MMVDLADCITADRAAAARTALGTRRWDSMSRYGKIFLRVYGGFTPNKRLWHKSKKRMVLLMQHDVCSL